MCGICGVIQVEGSPRPLLAPGAIERMTDAMTHRGPSDRGTFVADGVVLGVRRLSIIDVDGGHQPVADESERIWAVQNGELYNHDELRSALERAGHRFLSRCDTEVVPHLYEQHGAAFQEHLTGMFAIAVWDAARRRAVLARDRLGIKPLYYHRCGDLIVFASELKCLLSSGLVRTRLDYDALDAYLDLGYVPAPQTALLGVRKLMPGHRLVVDGGAVREEQYWSYPHPAPDESMGAGDAEERLLAELERAVRRRLMSDVPLGAMLSGGLDSSLIVALMARNMAEPVKTFSVGFTDAGEASELADARLVASAFGTEHHALELSFAEQSVELDELAWWLDEPLADLGALGFLALSQLAAHHVTVALCGQGADELLGGYSRYRSAAVVARARRLPGFLRRPGTIALRRAGRRYERLAAAIDADDQTACQLALASPWLEPAVRRRLTRGPLAELDSGAAARRAIETRAHDLRADALEARMYLDANLSLVDDMLHYFDRASMAHSLEVRVPFLDHHVVELCASIPSALKVRRGTTKYVLKRLARGMLPERAIEKPKVGFFFNSTRDWMKAQLRGPAEDFLLHGEMACGEFLDVSEIRRIAAAEGERGPRQLDALFVVLMLEAWLTHVLPRALAAPEPVRERICVRA